MVRSFQLHSPFRPCGDQPAAIESLLAAFSATNARRTLLGVTGSGKTFTLANVVEKLQVPTLVLAPNKTLAAQLYQEFLLLFPENAVEYFVSYYDYYQPEAYLPSSDTFIEKDARINEQIDRLRNAATASLLARRDVLVVASVSCIYGLGDPGTYAALALDFVRGSVMPRQELLRGLVRTQHQRAETDFRPGTFRVRGEAAEIWPIHERQRIWRLEFEGNTLEGILVCDPLTGEILEEPSSLRLYPVGHYVQPEERMELACERIRDEMITQCGVLQASGLGLAAERLERRTLADLEDLEELGYCSGIENYSRHFEGRNVGQPPFTLMHYFPKDFLCVVDESHVTLPQVYGMVRGDLARKESLVSHGFRLPSAKDNRPLAGPEFESLLGRVLYVSATPGRREEGLMNGSVVEQIVRPTGLLDPPIEVVTAKGQVEDAMARSLKAIQAGGRVLVTTLTKRSAEDLTEFFQEGGLHARYLHSDIDTLERTELLRDLRLGVFDVLVGINLLREGLDLPEVVLVLVLDADREGFLRSSTALIQICGRAARNVDGHVVFYADRRTDSMNTAIEESDRRRVIQQKANKRAGTVPQTIQKEIQPSLMGILNQREGVASRNSPEAPTPEKLEERRAELRAGMLRAASDMDFEAAIRLRDELKRLDSMELSLLG